VLRSGPSPCGETFWREFAPFVGRAGADPLTLAPERLKQRGYHGRLPGVCAKSGLDDRSTVSCLISLFVNRNADEVLPPNYLESPFKTRSAILRRVDFKL